MLEKSENGSLTTNVLTLIDPAGREVKVHEREFAGLARDGYILKYQDNAEYERYLKRIERRTYRKVEDPAEIKGKHAGRKIVVLGNGPSLNFYPPETFARHIIIGVNYITGYVNNPHYLMISDVDFFYAATAALAGVSRRTVVFVNGGAIEASKHFNPVTFHEKRGIRIDDRGRFALGGSILMAAQLAAHLTAPGDRIEILGADYRDWDGMSHYTERGYDYSYADFKRFNAPFNRLVTALATSGRRWVNLSPISRLVEFGVETEYPAELEEIAFEAGGPVARLPSGGFPDGEHVFKKTVSANLHIENSKFDILFDRDGFYATSDPAEIELLLGLDKAVLVRRPR